MAKQTIQEMTDKIQRLTFDKAERQIFEWVKTEKLTLKQYRKMCEANINSIF